MGANAAAPPVDGSQPAMPASADHKDKSNTQGDMSAAPDDREAKLYVDVNVANFGIKRIIVYEGDTVESLVADFVKRCPIDEFMVEKLKLLLQQQMDGVLERIDEDEEQKTDQSALTDGEEAEGATEMRTVDKNARKNVTSGMQASSKAHEVESGEDSLAQTAQALADQKMMEGEGIRTQPFREEDSGSLERIGKRKSKERSAQQQQESSGKGQSRR